MKETRRQPQFAIWNHDQETPEFRLTVILVRISGNTVDFLVGSDNNFPRKVRLEIFHYLQSAFQLLSKLAYHIGWPFKSCNSIVFSIFYRAKNEISTFF